MEGFIYWLGAITLAISVAAGVFSAVYIAEHPHKKRRGM